MSVNEASVRVSHGSASMSGCRSQIECVVRQDLKIHPQGLQDFSAELLSCLEQDLVLVAGAIAFADRRVRRRRSSGWRREIQLSIPVSNPDSWSHRRVAVPLREAITFLTGDNWEFQFRSGFEPLVTGQSSIDFSRASDAVIPFSNGLDSYSQWLLQSKRSDDRKLLRIHSKAVRTNRARRWNIEYSGHGNGARLDIPISLSVGNHPEPSYRARSFVFYALAALAAKKLGANRVVIGENGISSIGPSLLPYGDEHPYVGTHPGFTVRLSRFVNSLLGSSISFEHPELFRTKGQVLQDAITSTDNGWKHTVSCVRDCRNRLGASHCGICSGCLMRRVALHTMGLKDDSYSWNDLSRSKLDMCRSSCLARDITLNDEDMASHAIHIMEAASELGELGAKDPLFRRTAWELSPYKEQDMFSVSKKISSLFESHKLEWREFKESFSGDSLLWRFEDQ